MANIPLSEIPNAPTATFTATMDPGMVSAASRVAGSVGDQAKGDIRQGFGSSMVNPSEAGRIGQAEMGLGEATTHLGIGLESAVGETALAKQRYAMQEARNTGLLKFYQNESAIQKAAQTAYLNAPAEQRPAIWAQVTGKDGVNYLDGPDGSNPMTPLERMAMAPEALHSWHSGMAQASNQAFVAQESQQDAQNYAQFTSRLNQNDYAGSREIADSMLELNRIPASTHENMVKQIETKATYSGWVQAVQQNPSLSATIREQVATGKEIKGAENLSPQKLLEIANIGDAVKNQSDWATQKSYWDKFQSGVLADPKALEGDKVFEALPEKMQDALKQAILSVRSGTPEGQLYTSAAQHLVDNYPTRPSSDTSEANEVRTWILGNVPKENAQLFLDQIDKKQKERVANGGNLMPPTQLTQYASQSITRLLNSGTLGTFSKDALNEPEDDSPEHAAEVARAQAAFARAEGIKQKVLSSNCKTQQDVEDVIRKETRRIRAGSGLSSQAPEPPKPGAWEMFWKSASDPSAPSAAY